MIIPKTIAEIYLTQPFSENYKLHEIDPFVLVEEINNNRLPEYIIKWLISNKFDWPMTEEQEAEFKLRFL